MIKKIITHPGAAHRDDFLSVAIALALYGCVPVFRRDPTQEELEDAEVLVLDCGGRHEPERLNFDHHQLPRDADPECALSLFVRHLGLEEHFQLQSWYRTTVLLDSKGPFVTAKALGMEKLPEEIFSPIETVLIGWFGAREEFGDEMGDSVTEFLVDFGMDLLARIDDYSKVHSSIRELAKVVEVDDLQGFIAEETITFELSKAMAQYRARECPDVAFSITKSDRAGESWALYRYDDHPRVDFSRLSDDSRVIFAHKGGFIAKLAEGVDAGEALEMVKAALV